MPAQDRDHVISRPITKGGVAMPIITLFSGLFCREQQVIDDIRASTGYRVISDDAVVAEASRKFGVPEGKVRRACAAKTSVFNRFTREKESCVAYLKCALGGLLDGEHLLVSGFTSHLIPTRISHALRVCLIADMNYRRRVAGESGDRKERDVLREIHSRDEDCAAWVELVRGQKDPWEASLYDLVIPMDKVGVAKAGALVAENLVKEVVRPTERSRQAVADFRLAAAVEVSLAREGHTVGVDAEAGRITLTINKHVLMLDRLKEELSAIAAKVPGVSVVETRVGRQFHQSDIYRKHDFELPSKVLLVDDEREFVQTLSERLLLRDMGSAVAYDGESALNMVREDEPEVMIIDLKMPGINGLDVLRQVKATRPEIEVIVLTGHGADADRKQCMELGAFGYLQKPVDIDQLSEMLKKAHDKIHRKRTLTDPAHRPPGCQGGGENA